jgi:hypothetical protein
MNQTTSRFASLYGFLRLSIPAFAICCLYAACHSAPKLSKEEEKIETDFRRLQAVEKKIFIPKLSDPGSIIGSLRHPLPYNYKMTDSVTIEIYADSTKLCLKGDSCWLEYKSSAIMHTIQKDGTIKKDSMASMEDTDIVPFK